jgi:hypothetical protein
MPWRNRLAVKWTQADVGLGRRNAANLVQRSDIQLEQCHYSFQETTLSQLPATAGGGTGCERSLVEDGGSAGTAACDAIASMGLMNDTGVMKSASTSGLRLPAPHRHFLG